MSRSLKRIIILGAVGVVLVGGIGMFLNTATGRDFVDPIVYKWKCGQAGGVVSKYDSFEICESKEMTSDAGKECGMVFDPKTGLRRIEPPCEGWCDEPGIESYGSGVCSLHTQIILNR